MALAGKDFKIQVNGTSGTWNEVKAMSASPELTRDQGEIPRFGDDAQRRIALLQDNTVELEIDVDASQPTGVTDLQNSVQNETVVQVEFSPDGNASGGPTTVYAFSTLVESMSLDASADSEQTQSFTLNNEDGTTFSTSASFS